MIFLAHLEKVSNDKVFDKVRQLTDDLNLVEKEVRVLKSEQVAIQKRLIIGSLEDMEDLKILTIVVKSADISDLRNITDEINTKFKDFAVVLGTVSAGKVFLVSRISKTLVGKVSAMEVSNLSAEIIGGRGGGRVDFAQAGGSSVEKIDLALEKAEQYFTHRLRGNL